MPNLTLIRPADGNEVTGAYIAAIEHPFTPTVLALSRQNVPNLEGSSVEKTLQGSLSPFVAWMSQRTEVSDDELAELEALVANLQSKRKEG